MRRWLAALAVLPLACAPAPTPVAVPSPTPSLAPPTAAPTDTATPTPGPTPTPDVCPDGKPVATQDPNAAPEPSTATLIIGGEVLDPDGRPTDEALVTATSLDVSVPYRATASTVDGMFVINNVPNGARMRFEAKTPDGRTSTALGTYEKRSGCDVFPEGRIVFRLPPLLPMASVPPTPQPR